MDAEKTVLAMFMRGAEERFVTITAKSDLSEMTHMSDEFTEEEVRAHFRGLGMPDQEIDQHIAVARQKSAKGE